MNPLAPLQARFKQDSQASAAGGSAYIASPQPLGVAGSSLYPAAGHPASAGGFHAAANGNPPQSARSATSTLQVTTPLVRETPGYMTSAPTSVPAGAVGLWLGRRQSASAGGSNNLLEYSLHWETLDPQLLARLACTVPGQRDDVGFEHYLNALHPGDVNAELKSIRSQLLDRAPTATSCLRLKLDEQRCVAARVTRTFEFAPVNGELSRMQLLVEVLADRA